MTGSPRRRPGRPAADSPSDSRELIVAAARAQFAEKGFEGATLRAIAAAAGVDPALIRHYFRHKAGLLFATMQLPVDPQQIIEPMFAAGPDGLGRRIVQTFLTTWDPYREIFSGLLRTTIANSDQSPPALAVMRSIVLADLVTVLSGDDRQLRATLVVSQLVGMATLRYVLEVPPLATAEIETVTDLYGPQLQALITPGGALQRDTVAGPRVDDPKLS